jgi:bifunctional polynucleotide phosphatase/kinase
MFKYTENIIYLLDFKKKELPNKVKVAAFDFDHTIVRPRNGKVHPKDIDDYEIVFKNVIPKLEEYISNGFMIVIFSNQSDLLSNEPKEKRVLGRFLRFREEFCKKINIIISVKRDHCRKPNLGMIDFLESKMGKKIDIKNSFYVGDAAGRIKAGKIKKDFACSDRMFAMNLGIKFYTPEEFFLGKDDREYILNDSAKELFLDSLGKNILEKLKERDLLLKNISNEYDIIFLIGSPASGKSFISNKILELSNTKIELLSNDILNTKAKTLKKYRECLGKNIKVIIDNTNPSKSYRKQFLEIGLKTGKNILGIDTNLNKQQTMFLNNYRANLLKNERLPDVAIHSYYKKYETPKEEEGFSKVENIDFIPGYYEIDKNGKLKIDKKKELVFKQYF